MAAAGWKMVHPKSHDKTAGVLFSVRASDLPELPALAKKYYDLGFELYATTGNAATIERSGMKVTHIAKVHENYHDNVMTLLESGKVVYVVSTSARGRDPVAESVKLRRLAVERDIDCLTSVDTANALADCLAGGYSLENASLVDINKKL
jgi:carbamoyl-phosphate synthase large subunit